MSDATEAEAQDIHDRPHTVVSTTALARAGWLLHVGYEPVTGRHLQITLAAGEDPDAWEVLSCLHSDEPTPPEDWAFDTEYVVEALEHLAWHLDTDTLPGTEAEPGE